MKPITSQIQKVLHFILVFLTIPIIVGFAVFSIMPGAVQAAESDLKVGVITSFKMECGKGTLKAARMAADEINAMGGILGRKIQIISGDTESSPEKGIMALKRLVEKDKVDILIGGASSGVVLAEMDYLKNYNKIFMSVGVSSPSIAKKVAEKYDLHDDWLNDGVKGFLVEHAQKVLFNWSNLKIYFADPEYLLAMKAFASRVDATDKEDILFLIGELKIRSADEIFQIIEKYYPQNRIKPATKFFIEEILTQNDNNKKNQADDREGSE